MLRPSLECWELDPVNCFENYIGWDDCRIPLVIASRFLPFVRYGGSASNSLVLIHPRGLHLAKHQRRFSSTSINWVSSLVLTPLSIVVLTCHFNFSHKIKICAQVFCNRRSKQSRLTTILWTVRHRLASTHEIHEPTSCWFSCQPSWFRSWSNRILERRNDSGSIFKPDRGVPHQRVNALAFSWQRLHRRPNRASIASGAATSRGNNSLS